MNCSKYKIVDGEKQKQCHKCRLFKPFDQFNRCKDNKDGYLGTCRECMHIIDEKRRRDAGMVPRVDFLHKRAISDGVAFKQCKKCGEFKPIEEFYSGKSNSPDGVHYTCKKCEKEEHAKKYYGDPNFMAHTKNVCNTNKKKRRDCAKALCKKINDNLILKLTCPVCGKEFGILKSEYDARYRLYGVLRRFCSRRCKGIASRREWSEKSPYAQNIKRIRKEQRL